MFRVASRNKGTVVLSIGGMAVGIGMALLIGFWSLSEFSFDRFHQDADNIYRVCLKAFINSETTVSGSEYKPVGEISKERFPEVQDMTRVYPVKRDLIKIDGVSVNEDNMCITDKNFFQFFSFELKEGNPATCLDSPDKVVIDESFARTYFPGKSGIGQLVEFYGKKYQVSAIMKDMPKNSHLRYHLLFLIEGVDWVKNRSWGSDDGFMTYFKLKKNTDLDALAKKITQMTYEFFPLYKQVKLTHFLQPLNDIHFSDFRFNQVVTSDKRIVLIFITLAVVILVIACFNFINLFISTSFQRAKSIGIKKINGCSKTSLFVGSYVEMAVCMLVALVLAVLLVVLVLPYFKELSGADFEVNLKDYRVYLYTGLLLLVTIFIAGTVPVWYILRFNPEQVIRGRFKGGAVSVIQKTLIVCQFAASIALIASAGIIQKQIHFIQNMDLGFNRHQIVYFLCGNMSDKYETVRQELLKNPAVKAVTIKSCLPNEWNNGNVVINPENPDLQPIMEICRVGYNYPEMMEMSLVQGVNPFRSDTRNSNRCMINEQAAKMLGLVNPVGKQIKGSGTDGVLTIAGVLKNAYAKSLHLQIDPQVYCLYEWNNSNAVIMVKTTSDIPSVVRSIEKLWKIYNTEKPLEYHFLDEAYDLMYKTEQTASEIMTVGMVIALFLAFMGLFGISHYATECRTKEIGVRRVNGAMVGEVLFLLNRSFILWVMASFVLAAPLTYYVMGKWLENFVYKTEMSWWVFFASGLLAFVIAVLTVSGQTWKAATRNPVESLRYE